MGIPDVIIDLNGEISSHETNGKKQDTKFCKEDGYSGQSVNSDGLFKINEVEGLASV
jgi:hypothetical protein